MPSIQQTSNPSQVADETIQLPQEFPPLPDDVLERFDSLNQWQTDLEAWWTNVVDAVSGSVDSAGTTINYINNNAQSTSQSFAQFKASVTTQINTIVNTQGAQAQEIVTVSAMAGVSSNISVQSTAPISPSINDYWINTSLTPAATFQWSGTAWVAVTTPIAFAGVATEKLARVTADGYLSGKYTLTVIAGNVVTGFNITSSTGSGSDVSNVSFTTGAFQIYDGSSTSYPVFSASAGVITLASTLVVNTSGKVFIGTGTYDNSNTPFYVDSTGKLSLGTALTWDGTTLTVAGSAVTTVNYNTQVTNRPTNNGGGIIVSNSPTTAGLYLGATYLGYYTGAAWTTYMDSSGDFYLGGTGGALIWNGSTLSITSGNLGGASTVTVSSSGLAVGTSGSVSGGQTGYNTGTGFWIGYTGGHYKFSIGNGSTEYLTWDGSTFAISGTLNATSGMIGGWTINSTTLTGGGVTLDSAGTISVSDSHSNYAAMTSGQFIIYNNAAAENVVTLSTSGTILTVPIVHWTSLEMLSILGTGGSQSAGTYGFYIDFGSESGSNYWSIDTDGIMAFSTGGTVAATISPSQVFSFTNIIGGSITGNAATATALQTGRTINGTTFDGTANIVTTAAAGTLTGTTLASGVTTCSLCIFGGTTSWAFNGATGNNYLSVTDDGTHYANFGSISGGNLYCYTTGYIHLYAGGSVYLYIASSGAIQIAHYGSGSMYTDASGYISVSTTTSAPGTSSVDFGTYGPIAYHGSLSAVLCEPAAWESVVVGGTSYKRPLYT